MMAFCNESQQNKLRNSSRASSELQYQPPKIIQGIIHSLGQGDHMVIGSYGGGCLELAGEVVGSQQGEGHGPQLAKYLAPCPRECVLLYLRNGSHNFMESFLTVVR